MSAETRVDRHLPEILADLGAGPSPDYTDSLLARTSSTRQRPGWVFAERWFPMSAISGRLAIAPRVPMPAVVAIALLVLAIVAGVLYAGSRPQRVPAPFGPAVNGAIIYAADGDLFAADPATGRSTLLVNGPEVDSAPGYSPDGTRIAFLRATGSGPALMVGDADGSDVRALATYEGDTLAWANWAPDSRHLGVIRAAPDGTSRLELVDGTGSGSVTPVTSAGEMTWFQFRPPDGGEILYRVVNGDRDALWVISADGTNPRLLTERPFVAMWAGTAAWSPDGTRIFYTRDFEEPSPTGTCCDLWVMNADGSGQRQFIPSDGTYWNGVPVVSPDGGRLVYWGTEADGQLQVARTDGTGSPVRVGPRAADGFAWYWWSPDGTRILARANGDAGTTYLVNPDDGTSTTLTWAAATDLDWQRLAR